MFCAPKRAENGGMGKERRFTFTTKNTMSEAEALYHRIADAMPDGKKSKMFGAQCVKAANGKAAFMYYKDCIVFKLTGDAEQQALSLDGAHYFNPMGDRPMNGWVQVPFHYADQWEAMARQSMDYVKALQK